LERKFEEGETVRLIPQYAMIFREKGNLFDLDQEFKVKRVENDQLWIEGLDGPQAAMFFEKI
jgi:hypothetical protein